jgi:hypothetical protein
MRKYTLILSLLVFSAGFLTAQCVRWDAKKGMWLDAYDLPCVNTLITSVPFLRIVPDARSAAMGDAGVAISPDANAIHFNASKLAFATEDVGVSATYSPWLRNLGLSDVYLAYLTGYKKLDEFQAIGGGLRFFSLGQIDYRDEFGTDTGFGKPNEFEVSLAYARKLSDNFAAALTGKFIYSNLAAGEQVGGIDIVAGTAGAVDLSVTYQNDIALGAMPATLRIGAAVTNIGSKISYTRNEYRDFLPGNLGIGGALDMDFDDFNRLTFTFDINKLLVPTPLHDLDPNYDVNSNGVADHREKSLFSGIFESFSDAPSKGEEWKEFAFSVGAEYWYDQQFAVRAGYYYENPIKGNRQYLTAGLGLKYNVFGLNVSYLVPTSNQRSPLDNTLRFSLLFNFEPIQTDAVPSDENG